RAPQEASSASQYQSHRLQKELPPDPGVLSVPDSGSALCGRGDSGRLDPAASTHFTSLLQP
ncbi:hypothetical protein GOODEAATRI_031011, partial [Goodea atripinnis]